MSLLAGFLSAALGLLLIWATRDAGDSDGDFLGLAGVVRAAGIFFLVVATFYAVTGLGCLLGRQWGRVTAIIFNVLVGGVGVLGVSDAGLASFPVLTVIWSAAIVALAIAGRPGGRA